MSRSRVPQGNSRQNFEITFKTGIKKLSPAGMRAYAEEDVEKLERSGDSDSEMHRIAHELNHRAQPLVSNL